MKSMSTALDPKRMVAELKELRSRTSDDNGAQRVAFTRTWVETRAWLKSKLETLPVEVHTDAAGNLWATLRGQSDDALLIVPRDRAQDVKLAVTALQTRKPSAT